MKKISEKTSLLIPGDFPPVVSGIATYFHEIWRNFPSDKCYILASKDTGWKDFDSTSSLNIIRRKIPTGNSAKDKLLKGVLHTIWAFFLHIKYNFKIIHCGQVLSSGITGWVMKKLFGIPYIIYVYGSETFRFGNNRFLIKSIKAFLDNAERIIPNSRFTMREFLTLGIPRDKFDVITPGVDTSRFFPAPKEKSLVKKYNLSEKYVLMTVARLDERKGHDYVIRAIADLKNDYPNIVYLIVGKGREEQNLRSLVMETGVKDQVIFCGYVSDEDLPKYYNLSDTFILLNRQSTNNEQLRGDYEGFGIVFLEASACGKPVIAGNYGGIADAIEDQKSGYIIDGTDLSTVTDAIKSLIENSNKRNTIGQYGLNRARRSFDWKTISKKIVHYL
ncbi:MAG: glycosyltransferase family 4 protein [Candidatus Marinimicrobia bacterium]|nr:glycosyltransferase family 4 protein [Candidatus Neomarinimicrobiota bacterium]